MATRMKGAGRRNSAPLQRAKAELLAITAILTVAGFMTNLHAGERKRLIVLTDFYKDPDDKQSMIRLLTYANEFDIEGLVATSLAYGTGEVHPEWIKDLIDKYGKVLGNLRLHERPGFAYPSVEELKSVVKEGAHVKRRWQGAKRGFPVPYPKGARDPRSCDPVTDWIGPSKDTPASDHIISVVDEKDTRPVWVVVWGGPMDLAQALWRVRHDRTAAQAAEFVGKLRVYQVSWQDTGAVWIWEQFRKLFMIQTSDAVRGMYQEGDPAYRNQDWVDANVKNGHGPLGAQYPKVGKTNGVKEGDTPSFLYLLAPGLSDPAHPEWGCWGGRFKAYGNGTCFYVDARDTHPGISDVMEEERWTVGRWNRQRNLDFAARVDWCVHDYAHANHDPAACLNGDESTNVLQRIVTSGQTVSLSASGSSDPDGDNLRYHWWQYEEADSYEDAVEIEDSDSENACFVAPPVDSPKTIHIILKVTDDGNPNLTSYRRLVVTVRPADKAR